ncbi:hypothetical protein LIER_27126 [Lithospermum erythrorhizon]|uniref:J domain-containing protein n=1 Tax=Lithospermum erythrorhizon TaxID=34254 RepID=A0AAV3RE68_LITER
MASGGEKSNDFYAVLGLKKECTAADLRNSYKKLAMKWHPDRCSASGSPNSVEEAKKNFQAIQEAYAVLSDENKRFLYDVGVYDCDDDNDENGMGDFLDEMAAMMNQNKSNDNREESFEQLQDLFEEMFQSDIQRFSCSSRSSTSPCSMSSFTSSSEGNATNKRNSSDFNFGNFNSNAALFEEFCLGVENEGSSRNGRETGGRIPAGRTGNSRRGGTKQKVSSGHDVTSLN